MKITYCDICGAVTEYYMVRLRMDCPNYGHGVNINWDLCSSCGVFIEKLVKILKAKGECKNAKC